MNIGNFLDLLKLRRLSAFRRRRAAARSRPEQEPALRAELFSAEQMERHGRALAAQHRLSARQNADLLLARLADNEAVLAHTCERLTHATRKHLRITPAGEWLLDNFYLIEEQVRSARRHLPKGYSRELSRLAQGPSTGLPRVYDIALEIISHGDGRVDTHRLQRFIHAYQEVSPLKLGELWAIPIMLRLALIENLRRVAARVMADWRCRGQAARWADSLIATTERDPNSVVLVVADMARSGPPMNSPFVAEMARRLQGQSPALALPLSWIEQRLAASGQSIEHLVQVEAQQQATDQVTISNSIGSLRTLAAIDWRDFTEHCSLLEDRLHTDPAGIYAAMDFATRDRYRHVVEAIARKHRLTELAVADAALALAADAAVSSANGALAQHVGYYLIDRGQRELERKLGIRPGLRVAMRRVFDRAPLPIYLGVLILLTGAFAEPLVLAAAHDGWPLWALIAIALPAVLLASQLGLSLLNWLATLSIAPRQLPRMDYSQGIPAQARTLVAIPTLFASEQDVEELVEALEVRFLGNRDEHLHFALLTDFADADSETLPGDDGLLRLAQRRIEALNDRYASAGADRFFLFHRPRRWNAAECCWMGHERKRGKLADLNALLRGNGQAAFMCVVGDIATLPPVQYVITLDTDTELPRDAAQAFVGAMDHPLNRAVYDPALRRVVSGYAILQPRVGISLPSTARSRYAQLYGSDAGIDPYTQMVSDVYQDVFGEGSFIGKGIYAVEAFERTLDGRFPEDRILSHDLVEGCHARSGLLSDAQLFEAYPSRYTADVKRRHRWIRGDWQLLPWLLPWAPTASGGWRRNALTALSRWKILDNLRRSLVPVSVVALLLVGWLLISPTLSWMLAVLAMVLVPSLLSAVLELVQKPRDVELDQHLRAGLPGGMQHFARMILGLAWLPHEAQYHLDAIVRTLWRMAISHRHLLQWQTSSDVERRSSHAASTMWRLMWSGPALAVVMAVLLLQRPTALWLAAPLLLLWLISPVLAWWISQPRKQDAFVPDARQQRFLRTLARQTWAFFDVHVNAAEHWLPPDNLQELPGPVIAHRTSPTNIGMALLAGLAAHDFGFLGTARLLERTGLTLATMQQLARHRGHFYNWYDTQTLQPLAPLYVSAVDSGNLAGHLLTLSPGLLELIDAPVFDTRVLQGLLDTLELLHDALEREAAAHLVTLRQQLAEALAAPPQSSSAVVPLLGDLRAQARALASTLNTPVDSDARFWLDALRDQTSELHADAVLFDLDPPAGENVGFARIPTLQQLAHIEPLCWPATAQAERVRESASTRIGLIEQLANLADDLAQMDYRFLYNDTRDLLAIGFHVDQHRLDASYYDLLASEVRLASFVAIAQGQLPQDNWFALGRLLTTVGGEPVLLSWTGSMFEYLMPRLVMPGFEGTLLDQTCRAAVTRQIEYGNQLGIPWGVSESGYNMLDAHFTYQYRAFGVPGLGLKRGLGDDVVVAPYASALALMVAPAAATKNLQRLTEVGACGLYGLYEAIDYTPARLPLGQDAAIVRQFMAHHQGMILLALDYALLDRPMQRRFESQPQFQASSLLLQERVPKTAAEYLHATGFPERDGGVRAEARLRVFAEPNRALPAVQLLSNGRYHVMLSSGGGGYSRRGELALTRWHEDITRDQWGTFCYLREVASNACWSTAYQPTCTRTEQFEAIFSEARAEFRVREREFDAHTEIAVSPEDDVELRRTHLTNRGRTRRTIELTSYGEIVLAPPLADALHPAFSKLFVQTELIPELQAIVCTRRPRAAGEQMPWMFHLLAVHDADIEQISYETDRARFLGRGRSTADPQVFDRSCTRLSNSDGSVLDPIMAIRCRITLEPDQSATIDFVSGIAEQREGCLQLIGKYRDRPLAARVFNLAWTHSQVLLRQLNASLADAQLYEHMATSILYPNASLRAPTAVLRSNRRGQSALWGQSISGDLPIVLLQISSPARIELVRQLVQAHAYWRLKGLAVDLMIWNEDRAGYRQELQDQIMGLIASGSEASLLERPGGIFVRPSQQLSSEDRGVMLASARLVLSDARGSLAEQIGRRQPESHAALFEATRPLRHDSHPAVATDLRVPALQLGNPHGGFSADGREYLIVQQPGDSTPAPWCNVLANPHFGTVISESGSAYTWAENAHEFRLSPWHNDPVSDGGGEALYLRDEETGQCWSPTPLPRRGSGSYLTRHGFGYSVFEHIEDGIHSELWIYVALDASVKFSVLKLRNSSGRPRKLSATGYVEWMLGDLREKTAMHIVTESDPASGAIFARNTYNTEFPDRVAFLDIDDPARSIDGDRGEFLGRNGSMQAPAGLARAHLSGRLGAGLDPCTALQSQVLLEDGAERQLIFRLGLGRNAGDASALVQRFRGSGSAADALDKVRAHWAHTLGTVQVHTPEPALDVLANGWLLYQTIGCRIWARSGYYQSGGAFGFRDQLQDSMATLHAAPDIARAQLLLCAAHQFVEGDVQHWWHPPLDRGVRTTCSDDYLWLPLATARYVLASDDHSVLEEQVGYLDGRALHPGEESYYDLPQRSGLRETLYQHCVRAINHSLGQRGAHGLPLIGGGDWNDGMNRVGEAGRGESVWLGFFTGEVLTRFAEVARLHGDETFAQRCDNEVTQLHLALEQHGWDGAWYRRAYFDDGTPLGSSSNEECRIDSIAQSWSVLSGMAPAQRRQQAMESLDQHLVRRDAGLVQLLDPPFDKSAVDPGYIKGYVPGVRENGGQYTHAAIWATMAFAELGDSARAWELLRMINPVNHGTDAAQMDVYKVEPYVVSADVYAVAPHIGRGGWSWYTGSAGWMYRLIVESLLGLRLEAGKLHFAPVLPPEWDGFRMDYRHHDSWYHIDVRQLEAGAAASVTLDGEVQPNGVIPLSKDGREHKVVIECSRAT